LSKLEIISQQQSIEENVTSEQTLEQLSEQDRQALIDLTITESEKVMSDKSKEVIEILEQQAD